MSQNFKEKSGKVLVIESTTSLRNLMTDVVKSIGFSEVQGVPTLKEALDMLEVEPIFWILAPLSADQPINLIHLLKICNEYPELKGTRFSMFCDENDAFALPLAFSYGLLSCHPKASSKDQLKDELSNLMTNFEKYNWSSTLLAASYVRDLLIKDNQIDDLYSFEKNLISTYPEQVELRFNLVEPLKRLDRKGELRSQLRLIRAMAPKEEKRVTELEKTLLKSDNDEAPVEGTVDNFLNINQVIAIDPDPSVQKHLTETLKTLGIDSIAVFDNSQEASDFLEKNGNPDLIIQEWRLKPISGSALLQRIKTQYAIGTPVIAISSLIQAQDMPLLREMGVAHVEQKPLESDKLIARIVNVISQDRSPTEIASIERKFRIEIRKGDVAAAEELFDTYCKTENVSPGMKRTLEAELLFSKGDFEKARNAAVEAIKISGDSLILLNLLGKSLLFLRDFPSAIKCFNKAKEMSPHNVERLCNMADAMNEAGDEEGAKETLSAAKDLDVNNDKIKETEARVAMSNGNFNEASRLLAELGSLDDVISYLNNQAVALSKLGDLNGGILQYKNALQSIPETHVNYKAMISYNLGLAAVKAKDLGEAKAALEVSLKYPDAKTYKRAASLAKRVEKALMTGQEVVLNIASSEATEVSKKDEATKEATPAPEQGQTTQNREARAALSAVKGERCCYMIFNPLKLPSEASALCGKEPRFNFRAAIERQEAMLKSS